MRVMMSWILRSGSATCRIPSHDLGQAMCNRRIAQLSPAPVPDLHNHEIGRNASMTSLSLGTACDSTIENQDNLHLDINVKRIIMNLPNQSTTVQVDSAEDFLVAFDLEKSDLIYQVQEENRGGQACRGRLSVQREGLTAGEMLYLTAASPPTL